MEYIETNKKYHRGMRIEEYNTIWSLVSCREGKDGAIYSEWAFPQDADRKPRQKAIPVKVILGASRDEAILNLKKLLFQIEGGAAPEEPTEVLDDEIPF